MTYYSTLHKIVVHSPGSLEEALRILDERRGVKIVAGGTDLLVQIRGGVIEGKELLNIYGLDELRYIKVDGNRLRVGALTTFSEIAESELVKRYASILAEAAGSVGSPQIRFKGTLGGNICNASPSGDSIPALYALDARLVLQSINGRREVPIERFFKGYKVLDLRENELLTEINLPLMAEDEDGVFLKFSLRLGDAISVVNTAIWVKRSGPNRFSDARVALGAVAPTIVRARKCEDIVKSGELDEDRMWDAAEAVLESISPITDIRGSAEYRRELAVNLVYKALWELTHRGRMNP